MIDFKLIPTIIVLSCIIAKMHIIYCYCNHKTQMQEKEKS